MLTQRLGSDTQKDPKYLEEFIRTVTEHPGCCDEVWLATNYGYPTVETHAHAAEVLEEAAGKLRAAGLRVSLQLSNTLGHGLSAAGYDNTGLVYEGSPAEHMVGPDGTTADFCFCWHGEHYRAYVLSTLAEYVHRVQPYCVWVDDDLRPNNHTPLQFGCFCDDCIKKFNERYGSHFTREELVHEISFGDVAWREKHIQFIRDGLADFTHALGETIHENAPDCRMGYQYCANGEYTGYGYAFIFDAMRDSTGHAPGCRPGGGAYEDHDLNAFIDKSEFLDMANRMLPDYVTDKRPEIESLPDIVFGKSIPATCFETSYYLASGNTAMSYSILMNDYEPMAWHGQMLAAFAAHRPYWEKLSAGASGTQQGGWVYAMSKTGYLAPAQEEIGYNKIPYNGATQLRYLGISIAMEDQPVKDAVRVLHPECAKRMSDAEIEELLGCPVVTDGETIRILNKRGFALPVAAEELNVGRKYSERFAAHPVNGKAEGRRWNGRWGGKATLSLRILDEKRVEPVSEYVHIVPANTPQEQCIPMKNSGINKYGTTGLCASAILDTGKGTKWAVFAFDFWGRGVSTEKRNQYLEAAAYISGHRQSAEILTPIQALLQTRVDAEDRLTQASITNVTVADSGKLVVRVYRPSGLHVTYMGQYHEEVEVELLSTDVEDVYELTVPNVKAWSVGTLFFA